MKKLNFAVISLIVTLLVAWILPVSADAPVKIDINKATLNELMTLQGIGESIATRIIEYREKNGPFKSPEEILNVKGIGQKCYEANKDRMLVQKIKK